MGLVSAFYNILWKCRRKKTFFVDCFWRAYVWDTYESISFYRIVHRSVFDHEFYFVCFISKKTVKYVFLTYIFLEKACLKFFIIMIYICHLSFTPTPSFVFVPYCDSVNVGITSLSIHTSFYTIVASLISYFDGFWSTHTITNDKWATVIRFRRYDWNMDRNIRSVKNVTNMNKYISSHSQLWLENLTSNNGRETLNVSKIHWHSNIKNQSKHVKQVDSFNTTVKNLSNGSVRRRKQLHMQGIL